MTNRVVYEWDLETFDPESGDVLDHHHADELVELFQACETGWGQDGLPDNDHQSLVLVRDVIHPFDGIVDRSWAYCNEQGLPSFFTVPTGDDALASTDVRVPSRFAREFNLWRAKRKEG